MKYKILTLTLIMCLFATTASAATHYLIVDNEGPASDILKMNALTSFIMGEGENSVTHLSNEVEETPNDVVTVFIYFGEVIITTPNKYESFANDIFDYLKTTYNIDAEI